MYLFPLVPSPRYLLPTRPFLQFRYLPSPSTFSAFPGPTSPQVHRVHQSTWQSTPPAQPGPRMSHRTTEHSLFFALPLWFSPLSFPLSRYRNFPFQPVVLHSFELVEFTLSLPTICSSAHPRQQQTFLYEAVISTVAGPPCLSSLTTLTRPTTTHLHLAAPTTTANTNHQSFLLKPAQLDPAASLCLAHQLVYTTTNVNTL